MYMNRQDKQDIIKLVEASRDAIVCSIDENGFPNAKTMFRRKNDGLQIFWFSSNASAIRTQQWLKNPNACVYFMDPQNFTGLMLTGNIRVCIDNETKQAFWEQGDEKYYPLGPTDPDYCMLCFISDRGNYYSGPQKHLFSVKEDMNEVNYDYSEGWRVIE
jgi:pyridoxamine 5'-phosphate oxidase